MSIRSAFAHLQKKPKAAPELLQFVKAHNIEYKQFSIGENRVQHCPTAIELTIDVVGTLHLFQSRRV